MNVTSSAGIWSRTKGMVSQRIGRVIAVHPEGDYQNVCATFHGDSDASAQNFTQTLFPPTKKKKTSYLYDAVKILQEVTWKISVLLCGWSVINIRSVLVMMMNRRRTLWDIMGFPQCLRRLTLMCLLFILQLHRKHHSTAVEGLNVNAALKCCLWLKQLQSFTFSIVPVTGIPPVTCTKTNKQTHAPVDCVTVEYWVFLVKTLLYCISLIY